MQRLVHKWDDPEMKVLAWEKTPESKEASYYLADWYKKVILHQIRISRKLPPLSFMAIRQQQNRRTGKFNVFKSRIQQGRLSDTSEIDAFIKELEGSGTDNLVKEVQKQLDEAVKAPEAVIIAAANYHYVY